MGISAASVYGLRKPFRVLSNLNQNDKEKLVKLEPKSSLKISLLLFSRKRKESNPFFR